MLPPYRPCAIHRMQLDLCTDNKKHMCLIFITTFGQVMGGGPSGELINAQTGGVTTARGKKQKKNTELYTE